MTGKQRVPEKKIVKTVQSEKSNTDKLKQNPQNAVWAVGTPAGRQKSQNLEKRAFSLPYVSHNVHYTKIHILKIRTFPSRRFLRSGGPDDLGCGILIFGTGNVSSPF